MKIVRDRIVMPHAELLAAEAGACLLRMESLARVVSKAAMSLESAAGQDPYDEKAPPLNRHITVTLPCDGISVTELRAAIKAADTLPEDI